MQFSRRVHIAAVGLATAALSLTACSASGGVASHAKLKLAVFPLAVANVYSQRNIAGVQKAVDEIGGSIDVYDGKFSGPVQLAAIEDAVAKGGYDGFVIFSNDGTAVVPGVAQAAEAGIPVLAGFSPIGPDQTKIEPQVKGVVATVWHPIIDNAHSLANLTIQACTVKHPDADPCKVAYISGGNSILFEQIKLQTFKHDIAGAARAIKIVSQQEGHFLIPDSRTAAENILQANSDLDVIASTADQMTMGAQQAVDDAGRTGITMIGTGASKEGTELIANGKWFGSPTYLPFDEGYISARTLIDFINGTAPKETVVDVVTRMGAPKEVTHANASKFTPQWSVTG